MKSDKMVTTARKTDAQRLGNGKKAFNVKQVEKMVEDAGGTEYTAGTGIVITDDTISVDEQTVAMKSELPDISQYQEKLTVGNGIDITNDVISMSDFELVDASSTHNFSDLVTFNASESKMVLKKDIIIAYSGYINIRECLFKDTNVYNSHIWETATYGAAGYTIYQLSLQDMFNENKTTISLYRYTRDMYGTNNSAYIMFDTNADNINKQNSSIKIYARR